VASAANFSGNQTTAVNFFVTAGTTYLIAVDGISGAVGAITLNLRTVAPSAPRIIYQPQSESVPYGSYAYFGVSASGTTPLSFQWRKEGFDIARATNTYYSIYAVQMNDAGAYSVIVSNAIGSVTSSDAVLAVLPIAPRITSQPECRTVPVNGNVSFSVTATGTAPLFYQWRKNDIAIRGATNMSYSILNAQTNDAGAYSVVVSNVASAVTSSNAVLIVNPSLGPPNDLFANRSVMAGLTNTVTGSNVSATQEVGEPNHSGNAGGKSVWWSWTAPANGTVAMDTISSTFDTVLAVYTGNSVSGLTRIASDDDSGGNGTSKLTFSAIAGTSYQIAVDGYGGVSGAVILHLLQVPSSIP